VKSQAEAESRRHRDYVWEWFKSDVLTRLKPKGRIVLVMTRWHPEDLGGQLLTRAAEEWRVVRLPALAEQDDPLGRPPGAPLWPEWEDGAALERKRSLMGERAWLALFQQNPVRAEDRILAVEQITLVEHCEPGDPMVRAWDLAATGDTGLNDPDWTVGIKMWREPNGKCVVLDVVRIRGTPRQVEQLIVQTAHRDGSRVIVALPEDPGQAGKAQASYLTAQLAGFHVISSRETGSKTIRATPLASQIEAGNVSMLKAAWNQIFIEELQDFPSGRKDDQVDALVRAFSILCTRPRTPGYVTASVMGR
jgi:predicted phage terminase large subunit-like protein